MKKDWPQSPRFAEAAALLCLVLLTGGAAAATPSITCPVGEYFCLECPTGSFSPSYLTGDGRGFAVVGSAVGDRLGAAVAPAGDVDGDGYPDLVVGAFDASPGSLKYAGRAFVVAGVQGNLASQLSAGALGGAGGHGGGAVNGSAAGDKAGFSVGGGGDVNGDGKADVVLGARWADPGGLSSAGEAYVVFGAEGFGLPASAGDLDGSNGFAVRGGAAGDNLGYAVAVGGDFDNDGFAG